MHHARIEPGASQTRLTYVLDFAEIPAFELTQRWQIPAANRTGLEARARTDAQTWLDNVRFESEGRVVVPRMITASAAVQDGAGGMPILRIEITAKCSAPSH